MSDGPPLLESMLWAASERGTREIADRADSLRARLEDSALRVVRLEEFCRETDGVTAFHEVVASMHGVAAAVAAALAGGLSEPWVREALSGARLVHATSPLVKRLQTWPRGYPGDFETVDQLLQHRNDAEPGAVGYWIEEYCLSSAIAQQHRNKVTAQAAVIRKTARENPGARILVIAAGGAADVEAAQDALVDGRCSVTLNDVDAAALRLANERLPHLRDRLDFLEGNILRIARLLPKERGPFDLIVCGGLFDYLDDRAAGLLTRVILTRMLAPQGTLFFTNIRHGNRFRPWMEYLADWRLIERDEAAIAALLGTSPDSDVASQCEADPSGLAWLVNVRRVATAPT